MIDPLARLPTTVRLWAAAGLSALPVGLPWSRHGEVGFTGYLDCGRAAAGNPACHPGAAFPGTPAVHALGAGSPARVFLVLAAVVLGWAASRPRTPSSRRWVRLATGAVLFALALAGAARAVPATVCLLAALTLAAPPAWRRPRSVPVFGNAPGGR